MKLVPLQILKYCTLEHIQNMKDGGIHDRWKSEAYLKHIPRRARGRPNNIASQPKEQHDREYDLVEHHADVKGGEAHYPLHKGGVESRACPASRTV